MRDAEWIDNRQSTGRNVLRGREHARMHVAGGQNADRGRRALGRGTGDRTMSRRGRCSSGRSCRIPRQVPRACPPSAFRRTTFRARIHGGVLRGATSADARGVMRARGRLAAHGRLQFQETGGGQTWHGAARWGPGHRLSNSTGHWMVGCFMPAGPLAPSPPSHRTPPL